MKQLPLNIMERLAYSPDNFVAHAGVRSSYEECLGLFGRGSFAISFFHGGPRQGKTHLSIKLGDALTKRGLYPRIVEGHELAEWLSSRPSSQAFQADEVIVVDDADGYLLRIGPGASGPFVAMVEQLRVSRAGLVLLSSKQISELPCDEHVISRLLPGEGFRIGVPSDDDMLDLIRSMGLQRGLSLTERQISFLARRLRRDVDSIEQCLGNVNYLSQVLGKSIKFPLLGDAV